MSEPNTPSEILKALEDESKRLQEFSTSVSQRIKWFVDWLNALPGKIEVENWEQHPEDGPDVKLGLKFHREGKKWILSHDIYHEEYSDPEDSSWRSLDDAPVHTKMGALQVFPAFLKKMAADQTLRVGKLRQVQKDFDKFAKEIGMPLKEEN